MIREGEPADWPQLRRIQAATLSDPWPELLELALGEPSLVLVLERTDLIGYALVVPDGKRAYLAEFAITPGQQGQGHGTTLMEALLDRLERDGVETIRLTARADDEHVHAFYETQGFRIIDRVPDQYDSGDGLLFEWKL